MFTNKKSEAFPREKFTTITPGIVFRWPRGAKIVAIDPMILALPKALFQKNEKIGDIVEADDEMEVAFPPDSENVLLIFQPGMSVTIRKNSESYLVAKDQTPRRVKIYEPPNSFAK